MPSIELPLRSLSLLFLFGSIAIAIWFPDKIFTPDLSRALFWWFLALGIVRWIENGLHYLLPKDADGDVERDWNWVAYTIAIIAFVFFVWCLAKGILYFFSVLASL